MSDFIIEGTPDKEVYNFLDELRDSGEINMFGARKYIVEMFDCNVEQATKLLSNWMKNYGK
tara:strand:- start:1361 stop:1543 length:183 start_codon:yes stop_codon:yes gene_type:complete